MTLPTSMSRIGVVIRDLVREANPGKLRKAFLLGILGCLTCGFTPPPTPPSQSLSVVVHDLQDAPAAGVQVSVNSERGRPLTTVTDEHGIAVVPIAIAGTYSVTITKPGFQPQTEREIAIKSGETMEVRFALILEISDRQQVSVNGDAEAPLDQGPSPAAELQGAEVKRLPLKPATVADALPLVPGVTRAADGQIQIEGANESQSAMLVNSLNVTDPQTGQFGLTVPTDSVESISVFKTPFAAQYGGFTAGVVSVVTKRGSEKWHFGLEDPFPEFRIRSGHLVGLRDASPIVTFGGPFKKDRVFSATSIQYILNKRPVRTLLFPYNESRLESVNLFTQVDYLLSAKHVLTATQHIAPQSARYLNLDFFNPREVTPNLRVTDLTTSLIDRYSFNVGLLQSSFGHRSKDAGTTSQGGADMILTPTGNRGNYFSTQDRTATRYELREEFLLKPVHARGIHDLATGIDMSTESSQGQFTARSVDILDMHGVLRRKIDFRGGQPYDASDSNVSLYLQDHWNIDERLALDLGSRAEKQRLSSAFRVAPRIGFSANPFPRLGTIVRGGLGIFYETVPLSPYVLQQYPSQVITTFDASGKAIDGPRLFANVVANSGRFPFPLTKLRQQPGNFIPSSFAWNVEIGQAISSRLQVRAGYLESASYGLLVLNSTRSRSANALVLSGTGESVYRQFELRSALKLKDGRKMFFSYAHSRSRGTLNHFSGYLGDTPYPIVQAAQVTNLDGDVPNRFLAWGTVGLPLKLELAPTFEVHNGFPYAVTDLLHNFVGIPNSDKTRFPMFFSLDARVSRDFTVSPKYGVRLSVTGLNLTDHFNALAVHSNIADPQFGAFFGTYPRRLRLDFDVLF